MNYILKGQDNKTYIIKTDKEKTLLEILDDLYNKGLIDLDKKEDLEFGNLYIPREEELDFLTKMNFKIFDLR